MPTLQDWQFLLQILQFLITVGIGALDLYVIYWTVGIFRHRTAIRRWMDDAFSHRLDMMTICPQCGYAPKARESRAEQLLRERGA